MSTHPHVSPMRSDYVYGCRDQFLPIVFDILEAVDVLGEAPRYAEHTSDGAGHPICTCSSKRPTGCSLVVVLDIRWLRTGSAWKIICASMVTLEKVKRDPPLLIQAVDVKGTNIYWAGHLFWPLLFFTRQASILIHGANFGERLLTKEDWFIPFGNFPFPGRPMNEVIHRYDIDYVVGNRPASTTTKG